MKKIIALAGAFALAACGGAETEEPMEADAPEEATEAAPTAEMAGTYSRTDEEGVVRSTTMNEDGTWSSTEDGEPSGSGTWTTDTENGTCFTDADSEEEARCFITGELAEDGTMEVTNPDGETYTVTKAE